MDIVATARSGLAGTERNMDGSNLGGLTSWMLSKAVEHQFRLFPGAGM